MDPQLIKRIVEAALLASSQPLTVVQLNGLLADTRQSLKKVDAVLVEAQAVGANAREATSDLGALRGEVESNLRRLEDVLSDIQRKWPFARKPELELP